jgi:hypothetical protein
MGAVDWSGARASSLLRWTAGVASKVENAAQFSTLRYRLGGDAVVGWMALYPSTKTVIRPCRVPPDACVPRRRCRVPDACAPRSMPAAWLNVLPAFVGASLLANGRRGLVRFASKLAPTVDSGSGFEGEKCCAVFHPTIPARSRAIVGWMTLYPSTETVIRPCRALPDACVLRLRSRLRGERTTRFCRSELAREWMLGIGQVREQARSYGGQREWLRRWKMLRSFPPDGTGSEAMRS